jgi:hypothetical protein
MYGEVRLWLYLNQVLLWINKGENRNCPRNVEEVSYIEFQDIWPVVYEIRQKTLLMALCKPAFVMDQYG